MNSERLLRGALFIGGLLTAMIGVDHIFMPTIGYDSSVSLEMEPAVGEHFYYLASTLSALFTIAGLSFYLFFQG
ncbi:MAG: hypothetical protein PVJ72_09145 [Gammaproteobacteria bacterium]|jgi:hypothetical protein